LKRLGNPIGERSIAPAPGLPAAPGVVYISAVVPTDRPEAAVPIETFIARVRAGDSSAFEEIVRRYEALVLRVARRMTGNREDALDVAQDSFLRIYKSLGHFRTGRRFEAWVYRIVVNASLDMLNRRGPREVAFLDDQEGAGPGGVPDSQTPEGQAAMAQLREKLDELLDELSPRARAVFVLRDVEGLETAEVARILGCRRVTVRRHSMESREKIRTLLNRRFPGLAPVRKNRDFP
jgi:RNA polymerase sigma-70 factor (ECF subfamily)